MRYYEIRIKETNELKTTIAKNFAEACKNIGYKPSKCKQIWRANAENACDSANY